MTTPNDTRARPHADGGAPRPRARDFYRAWGSFEPGPLNAITDVAGVCVGHATTKAPAGVDASRVRTGVTAVLPRGGNVFHERVVAGGFVLNGAGEVAGLTQVMEWGLVETPILLTGTMAVGRVADATVRAMLERFPTIGARHDVILPVVGECDDSWLNDVAVGVPSHEDVRRALDTATSGPVAEGSVGAGTGMMTCDFAGGIGTSSRRVTLAGHDYTVGVLVLSNFGRMDALRVGTIPFGRLVAPRFGGYDTRRVSYGSIISVVATDAPLMAPQLTRLAKRSALGIGRAGSYAAHGSGEIVLSFSTANVVPREHPEMRASLTVLLDAALDPIYAATAEATEEAIVNAVVGSSGMDGRDGHAAPGLPLDELERVCREYAAVEARLASQVGP